MRFAAADMPVDRFPAWAVTHAARPREAGSDIVPRVGAPDEDVSAVIRRCMGNQYFALQK